MGRVGVYCHGGRVGSVGEGSPAGRLKEWLLLLRTIPRFGRMRRMTLL